MERFSAQDELLLSSSKDPTEKIQKLMDDTERALVKHYFNETNVDIDLQKLVEEKDIPWHLRD